VSEKQIALFIAVNAKRIILNLKKIRLVKNNVKNVLKGVKYVMDLKLVLNAYQAIL
jgi:hypothetical protein